MIVPSGNDPTATGVLLFFLMLACDVSDPSTDSSGTETGGPDVKIPYDCPEAPAAPALSTTSWSQGEMPPAGGIWAFAGAEDGSLIYAGSHLAGMWSSTDRGTTWQPSNIMITHTIADLAVSPVNAEVVYRSSGGILQRSKDAGQNWTDLGVGILEPGNTEAAYAIAVAPWNENRVYAVVDTGLLYGSQDGGDNFEVLSDLPVSFGLGGPEGKPTNANRWRILAEPQEGGRLVFSDGSGLYTSDDGGTTWTGRAMSAFIPNSLVRQPGAVDHLHIAASDAVWESKDGGTTWLMANIAAGIQEAVWSPDGSTLVMASPDTLFRSTDGGNSFTSQPFEYAQVGALWLSDNEHLLMSWDNGVVATSDFGVTWTESSEGLVDTDQAVLATHPACDNIVLSGTTCQGGVFRSTDWSGTWVHADHYLHYVMAIHFSPFNYDEVWVVSDERLVRSRDGGVTFELVYNKYHFHGFGLNPDVEGSMLLGSVGEGEFSDSAMRVYRSDDAGVSWVDSSDGLPESTASAQTFAFWPGDADTVLLGTYKGGGYAHDRGNGIGLYVSSDGGLSWDKSSLGAVDIAWLATTQNAVVAATENGVWRTADAGATWTQGIGPSGTILSVDFKQDLGVAMSRSGDVWKSTDGGVTWSTLGDKLNTSGMGYLAQIAMSADLTTAYATVEFGGVVRIALQ